MPFMPPGTVVYYAERFDGGAPDHCLMSLCVVQLRDGKTLLKMVRKGQQHCRFDLQSYNMETIRLPAVETPPHGAAWMPLCKPEEMSMSATPRRAPGKAGARQPKPRLGLGRG
jgi:hypothetical protein